MRLIEHVAALPAIWESPITSPISKTVSRETGTVPTSTIAPQPLDEEEVRLTAYFLWEADGRPEGQEKHYWWRALEKIARQKANDVVLGRPPPSD
jgi:hypothetical protein